MTDKVCVVGLGYIGLPTACLFATHGCQVLGVDNDSRTVDKISRGELPFVEPGLGELLRQALDSDRLTVASQPQPVEAFVVAVPTPLDREARTADLRFVREAAGSIVAHLRPGATVILESTVPPGTSENLLLPILEGSGLKAGRDFWLAHCPERATPGNTLDEMVRNDRIIGGLDDESAEHARSLYASFVKGSFHLTDLSTAEIVKLMENTYRDINIALANEFAMIAERGGANIWEAIDLANKHPRVSILRPGPGVGGHCLAIDPWFLAGNHPSSRIVELARGINDSMPEHVLGLVRGLVAGIEEPVVSVLGVAYKADVDDTRETPALAFIELAEREGYRTMAHDPLVKDFARNLYSLEEAVRGSDCLVVMANHSRFKDIDPASISALMRTRNVVDTGNLLDHARWREAGFTVTVLGNGIRR